MMIRTDGGGEHWWASLQGGGMVAKERNLCSMTGVSGSCKKCGTIKRRPMWRVNQGSKVSGHNVMVIPR